MEFLPNNMIKLERELSELDLFALDFIKILRKHTKYAVVSGYVSILLGRARASEDIDIIVPRMDPISFSGLLKELKARGFYCLNAESYKDAYSYLNDNIPVRFAKEGTIIPNMELKFSKNKIDEISLTKIMTVKINKDEIVISHLEMQIAFKEEVLKSPKDIEDARHVRNIAKGHLDESLIKKYKVMLNGIYR